MMADVMGVFAPATWPAFVFVSARLTGLMMVSPFWSMFGVPRSVRGAVVVVLAAVLVGGAPLPAFPERALDVPLPLLTELVIGAGIGLVAAVIQHSLTLASEVIAMQTGLSLGQIFTGSVENGGPAMTQLFGFLGLGVFVGLGGHLMVLEGLAGSLQTIPPGTLPGFHGGASVALGTVGALFGDALQVAAPVSVAVTITNFAMAILSRAVPQLNAMAMSFAVSIAVGLVMFGAALPMVAKVVGRWIGAMPGGIHGMVGAFARP
jgi:flagellar biosynthetic protein FliR